MSEVFEGRFIRGQGDVDYLELLDIARTMLGPDPRRPHLPMLYCPDWNGLTEGHHWRGWWIQNSYGFAFAAQPFLGEPMRTFLANSQNLWFQVMGDGKTPYTFTRSSDSRSWVPPDGCLVDMAGAETSHRQGDGRVDMHDWAVEFTAAALVMQGELLLIGRDRDALAHYLPMLERAMAFIEARHDPANNLLRAGPAGNLLAPSFAGCRLPEGRYTMAYLTGLSINAIAALDRLIELERWANRHSQADRYCQLRQDIRRGLSSLTTDEGYFIKSLDPDGTRHGVLGKAKHGYFDTVCNADALCFHVADGHQARQIYTQLNQIGELRPHGLSITNYPSLDDMYETNGLFEYGCWINGGHWATVEGRLIMGYYRVGAYDDARRSMKACLSFADRFQLDAPLKDFGKSVWFDKQPVNLTVDPFAIPAAMLRGLFDYRYTPDALTLIPQIPPTIDRLEQHFPVYFGRKRIYLAVVGRGPITMVRINDHTYDQFEANTVVLNYEHLPDQASVQLLRGDAKPIAFAPAKRTSVAEQNINPPAEVADEAIKVRRILDQLTQSGRGDSYQAQHGRLILDEIAAFAKWRRLCADGHFSHLPAQTKDAADAEYLKAIHNLTKGLLRAV